MLSVEEALAGILARAERMPLEKTDLLHATGRVLAEYITADIDSPPFDNSAVDGYAIRAEDTSRVPQVLECIAEVVAGMAPAVTIRAGTAARIMTGAMVPEGADAIVMVEDTRVLSEGRVEIGATAAVGDCIRRRGEDIRKGDTVLSPGVLLGAAEIAILAAMGQPDFDTVSRPRVAIVTTGDEVDEVVRGVPPEPGRIRNSNRYALAALVHEAGAEIHCIVHIRDDPGETERALRDCAAPDGGADVIVTAGGVSVGDRDFVKPAVERLGSLDLWRVRMKPGKPVAFGRIGSTLFFGLPGNPISAMVTFELFVRPALWKMAGRSEAQLSRPRIQAIALETVPHTPGRREYVRAITTVSGQARTRPSGAQGSGMLRSMALANSLMVIPEESAGIEAGAHVEVILLR